MRTDNIALFLLVMYGTVALIIGIGSYISYEYLNLISSVSQDLSTVDIAFITASSVLFGFATLSYIRFSDRMSTLNQSASDLAKELCELHNKVVKDEALSSKIMFFEAQTDVFGGTNLDRCYGKAPKVISYAYTTVAYSFRWNLQKLYSKIISMYQLIPVITLTGSMIAFIFAFAPSLTNTLLFLGLALFLFTLPAMIIGWHYSNKWLDNYADTFFNIRMQILGQLEGILPSGYESNEFKMWLLQIEQEKSSNSRWRTVVD
jgi:ABC-type phosphate/phosphonate transport system permease subunit